LLQFAAEMNSERCVRLLIDSCQVRSDNNLKVSQRITGRRSDDDDNDGNTGGHADDSMLFGR
jgi:hypothetical protein